MSGDIDILRTFWKRLEKGTSSFSICTRVTLAISK